MVIKLSSVCGTGIACSIVLSISTVLPFVYAQRDVSDMVQPTTSNVDRTNNNTNVNLTAIVPAVYDTVTNKSSDNNSVTRTNSTTSTPISVVTSTTTQATPISK